MKNYWVRTASGKKYDYSLGVDNDVDLFDVAEHLSKIPRFCGACRPNFSVAQHSVLVSVAMERDGGGPIHGLYGLFHDGHEAFFGDMPTPLTDYMFDLLGTDIKERIVEGIDAAIFRRLNLEYPIPEVIASKLHYFDKAAFAAEGTSLVKGFKIPEGCPTADFGNINPVGSEQAYRMFIERYTRLSTLRQRWKAV